MGVRVDLQRKQALLDAIDDRPRRTLPGGSPGARPPRGEDAERQAGSINASIDANMLLFASDERGPLDQQAVGFPATRMDDREVCCLPWDACVSALWMAAHPATIDGPLAEEDAACNVETLLNTRTRRAIGGEEGFWNVHREVTKDAPARGNWAPDANLAALPSQHGMVKLYTRDKDFRRFSFLDVCAPRV